MWRHDAFYDPRILAAAGERSLKCAVQSLDERAQALSRAAKKQRVLKHVEATM